VAARDDSAAGPRPPLADRLTSRQWLVIDCVVAALAAGTMLSSVALHSYRYHAPIALVAACAAAATLPVGVRRIWPVPVFALVTLAACVLTAVSQVPARAPAPVLDLMAGMVIYMAAARCRRPGAVAMLAAAAAGFGVVFLTAPANSRSQADALRGLLVAGALWFVGDSVRERRRYLAGLAEQAAQRRRAEKERGRRAIREERMRIARELHDVVAHSLSMITVQAGVGRKIGAARPGEALRALRAVEVSSRGALEELRRILGLLRDDDTRGPSLAPAPGIADLGELAETTRAAGTPVELAMTGDTAALPPAAGLTVYRIVQEALTNVVKHAHGAEASVRVCAAPDGVRITVTDTGRGAPDGPAARAAPATPAGGAADRHGLVGMRERAAAFGGTLDAGPAPGGGFRVAAFLPSRGPAAGQVA
jgi:signal transduction histidine kinase